jgi:hypothetical protein
MKPEKDPLKAIFSTLQPDDEVIDWEREQRSLYRFKRERVLHSVEGTERPTFSFVDPDAKSSPDENPKPGPNLNELRPKSKDRPPRA